MYFTKNFAYLGIFAPNGGGGTSHTVAYRINNGDLNNVIYILQVTDQGYEGYDVPSVGGWYHMCMAQDTGVGAKICKQLESQGYFNGTGIE